MAVNRLTDGMPITTEWLNNLVDNINNALSGIDTLNAPKRFIEFYGSLFGTSPTSSLLVLSERIQGIVPAGGDKPTFETSIVFTKEFADSNVIVVATPSFSSAGTRKGRPFKAAASIAGVTSKGCELTVGLYDEDMQYNVGKVITVDYIAIGRRKA